MTYCNALGQNEEFAKRNYPRDAEKPESQSRYRGMQQPENARHVVDQVIGQAAVRPQNEDKEQEFLVGTRNSMIASTTSVFRIRCDQPRPMYTMS
jgi:hypothetical protein